MELLSMFITLDKTSKLKLCNVFEEQEKWVNNAEKKLLKTVFEAGQGALGIAAPYVFATEYATNFADTAQHNEPLKILDIGGGVGHFFPLIRAILNGQSPDIPIQFQVLDNKKNCSKGRNIFAQLANNESHISFPVFFPDGTLMPTIAIPPVNPTHNVRFYFHSRDSIEFHSDIQSCNAPYDIVISCIAILYMDDLSDIVAKINSARPKYVFFSYFLVNFDTSSLTLAQPFGDDCYMIVTAHSVEALQKTFADINYKMIEGSCREDQYPDEIPAAISQLHPHLTMADIYFMDNNYEV
jgi:hypothetical protein